MGVWWFYLLPNRKVWTKSCRLSSESFSKDETSPLSFYLKFSCEIDFFDIQISRKLHFSKALHRLNKSHRIQLLSHDNAEGLKKFVFSLRYFLDIKETIFEKVKIFLSFAWISDETPSAIFSTTLLFVFRTFSWTWSSRRATNFQRGCKWTQCKPSRIGNEKKALDFCVGQ